MDNGPSNWYTLIGKPMLASAVAFVALRFPTKCARRYMTKTEPDAKGVTYNQGLKWLESMAGKNACS